MPSLFTIASHDHDISVTFQHDKDRVTIISTRLRRIYIQGTMKEAANTLGVFPAALWTVDHKKKNFIYSA